MKMTQLEEANSAVLADDQPWHLEQWPVVGMQGVLTSKTLSDRSYMHTVAILVLPLGCRAATLAVAIARSATQITRVKGLLSCESSPRETP